MIEIDPNTPLPILALQIILFLAFVSMGFGLIIGGKAGFQKAARFWFVTVLGWPFRAVTRIFVQTLKFLLAPFLPAKKKKKRKKR